MHLANGTVTPLCALIGAAPAAGAIALAALGARRQATPDPLRLGLAGALVFAAQSFNVALLPQASGHLLGGVLLAALFGPAWGTLTMTAVLLAQSLLVGDGGLLTLGLNVLNMAALPCLLVWPLARRLCGGREVPAVILGGWASVVLAAGLASLELASLDAYRAGFVGATATLLGVHAVIGLFEAGVGAAALAVARAATARRLPAAALLGAATVAVAVAAASASSPFPDGLEYALALHRVPEVAGALVERLDAWQAALAPFSDYTTSATLLSAAATAGLAAGAVRLLGKRGHDAVD